MFQILLLNPNPSFIQSAFTQLSIDTWKITFTDKEMNYIIANSNKVQMTFNINDCITTNYFNESCTNKQISYICY